MASCSRPMIVVRVTAELSAFRKDRPVLGAQRFPSPPAPWPAPVVTDAPNGAMVKLISPLTQGAWPMYVDAPAVACMVRDAEGLTDDSARPLCSSATGAMSGRHDEVRTPAGTDDLVQVSGDGAHAGPGCDEALSRGPV